MDMLEKIQTVSRIQELDIIVAENRIMVNFNMMAKESLEKLEKEINELLESLPQDTRRRYLALKDSGKAVVKEFGGTCQHCRMTLSMPLLQRMREGTSEWICPCCGRFLLLNNQQSK